MDNVEQKSDLSHLDFRRMTPLHRSAVLRGVAVDMTDVKTVITIQQQELGGGPGSDKVELRMCAEDTSTRIGWRIEYERSRE